MWPRVDCSARPGTICYHGNGKWKPKRSWTACICCSTRSRGSWTSPAREWVVRAIVATNCGARSFTKSWPAASTSCSRTESRRPGGSRAWPRTHSPSSTSSSSTWWRWVRGRGPGTSMTGLCGGDTILHARLRPRVELPVGRVTSGSRRMVVRAVGHACRATTSK